MQKIVPSLWFNHNAEEAINFYISVFGEGKIISKSYYTESSPGTAGDVMGIEFELFGQRFFAINGGPAFKHSEALSLMVLCETQSEIDRLWDALSKNGGEESQCGWLKDKYGLSWQITPPVLLEKIRDKDKARADRVMQAMLKMRKINIAEIEQAYEGKKAA